MAEGRRRANFELLRILAMVMVVIMHFLARSDALPVLREPLGPVRFLGGLLEAFCLVAVNVYVLLSGYFGVKGHFKPGKAAALLGQIWFYALLVPAVLLLIGAIPLFSGIGITTVFSEEGVYGLVQYLFPVETEHYWFATSYFMLYLLTPVLNAAAAALSKRQFQITLAGLLILFCGIKSLSPVVFAFDRYGYDLPWFICLYLLAAYLRLYGWDFFEKRGWRIYLASALGSFGINLSMYFLSGRWDEFSYYFTVPYHYNFVLCLTGAVGLFYGFSRIHIKGEAAAERIRRAGGLCFGVYLLHEHIDLRGRWYGWISGLVNPAGREGAAFFLWELLCCTVILFGAGLGIEWIRSRVAHRAAALLERTGFYKKLKRLDEYFAE